MLLPDEPFSALDSFTRRRLHDHLMQLWSSVRFTLVFVTHDVEEAVVLVMRGRPRRSRRLPTR